MPNRTTSPRTSSTVMVTSSPTITLSPGRRVRTSMGRSSLDALVEAGYPTSAADERSADGESAAVEHHLDGATAALVNDDGRQEIRCRVGECGAGRHHEQDQQLLDVGDLEDLQRLVVDLGRVAGEEHAGGDDQEAQLRVGHR